MCQGRHALQMTYDGGLKVVQNKKAPISCRFALPNAPEISATKIPVSSPPVHRIVIPGPRRRRDIPIHAALPPTLVPSNAFFI